ncbi:hypothetical protein [Bhargavaea beijingensis]|uniref:Uncharacterized protein n=1 Tax=Bhargavaea beijingensis TaxID=426756 RepID=A0A1G7DU27_9BACL|nr:hypothetical protein [Bhargavaea beijingensis]MCW1928910.1 hypothetical protein [Bhargavaea beijingensis]SDE54690.1 hypothetical protein SAMN04488126_11162 [Bhargavaea beijingensis]
MKTSYHVAIMVILIVLSIALYNRGLAAAPLILLSVQLFYLFFSGWRTLKNKS